MKSLILKTLIHTFNKLYLSLLIAAFFSLTQLYAQSVQISITPNPPMKGQQTYLEFTSPEGYPELLEEPKIDGVKFLGYTSQSSQTEIINFKTTKRYSVSYAIVFEKDGEINFPSLKLKIGKKKIATDPFSITVISPKIPAQTQTDDNQSQTADESLDKLFFLHVNILSNQNEFFVGEEIPLEIAVYCPTGVRTKYSWPEINSQNIIFKDFSQINAENPKFAGYRTDTETIHGRTYNVFRFRTVIRAITAGSISGTVSVPTVISIPRTSNQRRRPRSFFDDDFFDSFFGDAFSTYQQIQHTITAKLPEIKILPLPDRPQNSIFTGLIGNWNISFNLSTDKFKTGEAFTLTINIEGSGGLDNLRFPELTLEGFRIFPPEIKKLSSAVEITQKATVDYVFIPTKEGNNSINLEFLTLSSATKQYQKHTFSKDIFIEKSSDIQQTAIISSTEQKNLPSIKKPKREMPADILYLKKGNYYSFIRPPAKINVIVSIIILLLAPILLIIAEIIRLFYKKPTNPEQLRKLSAISRKKSLLKKLQKLKQEEVNDFIRIELCPWLNDYYGYPPGTSPEEVAKKITDPQLSEIIIDSVQAAYMPETTKFDTQNKVEAIKNILKRLSTFIIFCFLFAINTIQANELSQSLSQISNPDPFELYDKANFKEATIAFAQELQNHPNDPYLLYNIGCCLYRQNLFAEALLFFQKAHLLAPRDSDIRENLNHTRRKLDLPEIGKVESPLQLLLNVRNYFRPDEWLLIFSISVFIAIFLFVLRKILPLNFVHTSIFLFSFLSILAIFASISLYFSDYNQNIAIIIRRNVSAHILPSENSDKLPTTFPEGETVKIIEERTDWVRIRLGNSEAWIKKDSIKKLWD